MGALHSIGEFSKLSHLSVSALRHCDEVGLVATS
jgi:DNA-binding transcriptional MerR regulator